MFLAAEQNRRIRNIGKVVWPCSPLVTEWKSFWAIGVSGKSIGKNKSEFYFVELGNSWLFFLTNFYYPKEGRYS